MTMGEDFVAGQAKLLDRLREETADRKAHARYLDRLIRVPFDQIDYVEPDAGVADRVAIALRDDVHWCRAEPPPPGWFCSEFPGAYAELRLKAARAAVKRERAAGDLGSLLRLDP
ncbi:hypothetical protein [Crossiella sp. CA198]|uniref:hypothetical protein n=1 Tax=Crossiella sp. CA198 TaxID=3455607 RepID=UPI003F8D3A92